MRRAFRTAAVAAGLVRHSRATRARVDAFRARRLREIVEHAYRTVPYYRALFDRHGIAPRHIQTPADLSRVPVTTRDDLQRVAPAELVSSAFDASRLIVHPTSGSSGRPVIVRRTWSEERLLNLLRLRALRHFGLRPTDRFAMIHFIRPPHANEDQRLHRVARRAGCLRFIGIACGMDPADMLTDLRRIDPQVVGGFPGVLLELAALRPRDAGVRPRFVVLGGEVATPQMRERIREGFGVPVFDLYGSFESNTIGWTCRRTADLHVCDDGVIVDVLAGGRPAGEGERGDVVLTNLHSFAMPFIRYGLGDVVTNGRATCACGQPFSTVHGVVGRTMDYLRLPEGRLLHPYDVVAALVPAYAWIGQYRVVQPHERRITLELAPRGTPPPDQLAEVRRRIEGAAGEGIEVVIELVRGIRAAPGQKYRMFQSLVHSEHDAEERSAL